MVHIPLEIDLLRAFLTVHQLGGFTPAADALGRSQPAISLQVKRLEQRAGVVLFERSRSGVVELTPAGVTLAGYANQILALHDEALASLAAPALRSRIRLGILEELGHSRLPLVLRAFKRAAPNATPQIQVSLSNQLVSDMLQNRIDLALVAGERSYPQGALAWSETVVWVGSATVPVAVRPPLPLILLPEPSWYRRSATRALDAAGLSWVQSCLSSTMAGIRATTIAGLGLTVMGQSEVTEGLRVAGADLHLPQLASADIMIYFRTRELASVAASLASHMRGLLAER